MKQSESFNASINKNHVDLCSDTKFSPDNSMLVDYKILNYDDSGWKNFLKEKQRSGQRARDNASHLRINSAQQSNPFGAGNPNICFSLDKKRSVYRIGEMSAPGSANPFNVQLSKSRRNRHNLNQNVKVPSILKQEASVPIKLDSSNKSFIDWKAVVVNTNDLNSQERVDLGFSPSYDEATIEREPLVFSRENSQSKFHKMNFYKSQQS